MNNKKRWIYVAIIVFVAIAVPVTIYLFQSGYFDTRNKAAEDCKTYWWYDNTATKCQQKEFCGTYQYEGLQTFSTETECTASFDVAQLKKSVIAQWNFNSTNGTVATNDAGTSSCAGTPANCNGTLYKFDDTTGVDKSLLSGWTVTSKKWGAASLLLDGVDDHVKNPNAPAFKKQVFTFEAWFKVSDISKMRTIANYSSSKGFYGWVLRVNTDGKLYFTTMNSTGGSKDSVSSPSALELNKWYYTAVVFGADSVKLYLDGAVVSEDVSKTSAVYASTMYMNFGNHVDHGRYFSGAVDSFRYWDTELSATQISNNYKLSNFEDLGSSQTTIPTTPTTPTTPTDEDILGDIDGDGDIDMTDYALFVDDYMDYKDLGTYKDRSDLNDDKKVNMADYALFVDSYTENK